MNHKINAELNKVLAGAYISLGKPGPGPNGKFSKEQIEDFRKRSIGSASSNLVEIGYGGVVKDILLDMPDEGFELIMQAAYKVKREVEG